MKKIILTLFFSVTLVILVSVNVTLAALSENDYFIYDSDTNLTWLKDANVALTLDYELSERSGYLTLDDALTFITYLNSISYLTGTNWRLPRDEDSVGPEVNVPNGELGDLYYNILGNNFNGSNFSECDTVNGYCFNNIQRYGYWTRTRWSETSDFYFTFNFYNGSVDIIERDAVRAVWIVHPGDLITGIAGDTWQGELTTWQGESVLW
jgi:hypothetical protein